MRVLITSVNVRYILVDLIERVCLMGFFIDLHLPTEIVPATLKKSARPAAPRRTCKFLYE
jgi:hypothetical protein